ncbi:MAG: DUF4194 domain-containing protein [Erysipelotrichales bacterium]|nr:DUF4194 domain-containing protein [Erysipelotrichales bacterium]
MINEEYDKLSNPKKQMFSDICNDLLASNYLVRAKKDNTEKYYFVINYKSLFEEFFAIIDYELIIDHENSCLQIVNQKNGSRLRLKRDESILLLILRLFYHQKMSTVSLNENIICTSAEIQSYYQNLKIKKNITKTDLVTIFRMFRRYNLIDILGDITQGNARIVIYPSILLALSTKNIQEVYNLVSKLTDDGEGETSEEVS